MEPFKKKNCTVIVTLLTIHKRFGNLTRVHNGDHISQSWPNPNQNLDSPDSKEWHPFFKQFLIWATVSAISEWWNWFCEVAAREHLYQKHPSGRFGFHCYFQFSCEDEDGVWVTESCIMSSIVVNIQYHIVKDIGILCLWGSFILRFLFYFCCASSTGTMQQQWWQPGTELLPPGSEWRRLIWFRKNQRLFLKSEKKQHLVLKYLLVVSQGLIYVVDFARFRDW